MMKIRTMVALGAGYVIGTKFAPRQIETHLRDAWDPQSRSRDTATRASATDASWPDPTFRL